MAARRRPGTRPARPDMTCETCGADLWWAWGVAGHVWTPLEPRRFSLDGDYGTYEVWRDAHGGLLAQYLEPGERGDQISSWRGVHHNAACGDWAARATGALVRESELAIPVMPDGQLLELMARLRTVSEGISLEIRRRALAHDHDDD